MDIENGGGGPKCWGIPWAGDEPNGGIICGNIGGWLPLMCDGGGGYAVYIL